MDESLQQLLDETAIRKVLARYTRGVDRHDRDLVESTYWPNAFDRHAIFEGNRQQLLDWLFPFLAGDKASSHVLGQSLFNVNGDTAVGETYFVAYHLVERESGEALSVAAGRYAHVFQKRAGEWRILRCDVVMDWSHLLDKVTGGLSPAALLDELAMGQRSKSDLTYALFDSSFESLQRPQR